GSVREAVEADPEHLRCLPLMEGEARPKRSQALQAASVGDTGGQSQSSGVAGSADVEEPRHAVAAGWVVISLEICAIARCAPVDEGDALTERRPRLGTPLP